MVKHSSSRRPISSISRGCQHATYLDVLDLANLAPSAPDDPFLALLQTKGSANERAYLEILRSQGREVVDLAAPGSDGDRFERTRAEVATGRDRVGAEPGRECCERGPGTQPITAAIGRGGRGHEARMIV